LGGKKGKMRKLLIPIIVVLFCFTLASAYAQAPTGQEYIIQADDWLSKIAEKEYGDPLLYPIIVEATNAKVAEDNSFTQITNPDVIEIGQKVWLPAVAESTPASLTVTSGNDRLTQEQLKNSTYSGIYEEPVTLTDGLYEGEPFVEGGVARPVVQYVDNSEVYGDLNGSGLDDTTVLLVENSGGSGVFSYVGAQLNQDEQAIDGGTALLGDRTQVISMVIENGQVVVDIVTPGPDEPLGPAKWQTGRGWLGRAGNRCPD
jgi:hypothetical protein